MKKEISFSKRVTFLSILFILPLVLFIMVVIAAPRAERFSRNPVLGVPIFTVQSSECFDVDTGIVATPDFYNWDCSEQGLDLRFSYDVQQSPHTAFYPTHRNIAVAYSDQPFETVTLAIVDDLNFEIGYSDEPFDRVAILRTAAGRYYKLQLISEWHWDIQFQWEPLR